MGKSGFRIIFLLSAGPKFVFIKFGFGICRSPWDLQSNIVTLLYRSQDNVEIYKIETSQVSQTSYLRYIVIEFVATLEKIIK